MEYRRFENVCVMRLDPGEEILEQIKALALKEHIRLAAVQGLGAVNALTLGVFDPETKTYHANEFTGKYEIVSLTGTVSTMQGAYYGHLHLSAGDESGCVVGGHLNRAVVSATAELVVTVLPGEVDRVFSEDIGLNIFRF